MSVYNDAQYVAASLDSMLSQEAVDLEFIVIDDGSTDGTGQILDGYAARDPRLRVIHQDNNGLTRALIHGCSQARGKYIARQDGGGDVSLPGRLRAQVEFLESHPEVVMTSCGTRFMGPEGEELYEVVQRSDELQRGLQELSIDRIRGPSHHGSTMFSRSAYLKVGGYRAPFRVAQDLDLWIRLAEIGEVIALPEVLYVAHLVPHSLSARHRNAQIQMARVALSCARKRRNGFDDQSLLDKLSSHLAPNNSERTRNATFLDARFYYFIASLLRHKSPNRAHYYYLKSLRSWRVFPRAFLALCRLRIRK